MRWMVQGRVPISSSYEYLSFLAWFVTLFYFIVMFKVRRPFVGAMRFSRSVPGDGIRRDVPASAGNDPGPGAPVLLAGNPYQLTIIGEAAFALAFVTGVLYLVKALAAGAR